MRPADNPASQSTKGKTARKYWFVGILGIIALGGVYITFNVISLFIQSNRIDPLFRQAFKIATESPEAKALLGEPVQAYAVKMRWGTGNAIPTSDGLIIPLRGPKREAQLAVVAHYETGKWHIVSMNLLAPGQPPITINANK